MVQKRDFNRVDLANLIWAYASGNSVVRVDVLDELPAELSLIEAPQNSTVLLALKNVLTSDRLLTYYDNRSVDLIDYSVENAVGILGVTPPVDNVVLTTSPEVLEHRLGLLEVGTLIRVFAQEPSTYPAVVTEQFFELV